nr:B3 domain-containing protein At5g60130-like isoform X1 [Ipomoea batatas]GMD86966.1 B3 domain-containing protein At5g60130-like isoform X1 [Ipomoea batatas]
MEKNLQFPLTSIWVEGEYARVVEFIRKGGGVESHDVFVLEADICSIVKKDVKKEDDIDINARDEGNGNDNHTVIFQDIREFRAIWGHSP